MTEDERLQEYLDGRMNAAARSEFEAAIARDSGLASQVRFAQALKERLRAGPAALPPGFHARARARFEATRGQSPIRRSRRIPWEPFGLAAAALLLAAILFPWKRDGAPGAPASTRENAATTEATDASQERGTESESAGESKIGAAETPATRADSPPPPAGSAPSVRSRQQRAVTAERLVAPTPTTVAPAAPPPEEAPAPPGSLSSRSEKREMRNDVAAAAPSDRDEAAFSKMARDAALDSEHPVPVATRVGTLPYGTLRAGFSAVIESPQDELWQTLVTDAGPVVQLLSPDFASERVFVIGSRDGAPSCEGIALLVRSHEVVVRVTSRISERAVAGGGCLVIIPSGNQPVRLEVAPEN